MRAASPGQSHIPRTWRWRSHDHRSSLVYSISRSSLAVITIATNLCVRFALINVSRVLSMRRIRNSQSHKTLSLGTPLATLMAMEPPSGLPRVSPWHFKRWFLAVALSCLTTVNESSKLSMIFFRTFILSQAQGYSLIGPTSQHNARIRSHCPANLDVDSNVKKWECE